jgi:L-fucose isomerase-like protein
MKSVKAGFNAMAVKFNPESICYCTLHGSLRPGPVGFARLSTDDVHGRIVGYVGNAEVTNDSLDTFGTTGVLKIPNLDKFMYFLTANGFEHHVAMSYSPRTAVLHEAFTKYLGWKIYYHNPEGQRTFDDCW